MKDKCIICGAETLFDVTDHVDLRYGYIEGAGQLCINCFEPRYKKSVNVPVHVILDAPNDMELGREVRKMYNKKSSL